MKDARTLVEHDPRELHQFRKDEQDFQFAVEPWGMQ